jgi:hypothetical protein
VPLLKKARYQVEYVEFPNGHIVSANLAEDAFRQLAG